MSLTFLYHEEIVTKCECES